MDLKMKLWVETDGRVVYGGGRHKLLQAIEKTGSLAGAARELKMSYRAAWGRLKASERRLGVSLVERGSEGRRGHQLTTQARELMQFFEHLEKQCESALAQAKIGWSLPSPQNAEKEE